MFNNGVPPWGTLLLELDAAQTTMEWKTKEIVEKTYTDALKRKCKKACGWRICNRHMISIP